MPKLVPRQRKHKARWRGEENAEKGRAAEIDSNVTEILPAQRKEFEKLKAAERVKLKLAGVKVSSKKKKRLDKYIETKLKREENQDLIRKLANQKIDTSLLQSAKNLGRRKETKNERFNRAVKEVRAGHDVAQNRKILLERRRYKLADEADAVSETSEEPDDDEVQLQPSTTPEEVTGSTVAFGSGLKRPLELDETRKPIIKKRKRNKGMTTVFIQPREGLEWEGFSSDTEERASALSESQSLSSMTEDESYHDNAEEDEEGDGEANVDEEDTDASDDELRERKADLKSRTSAFKEWATKQRNDAVGFVPSTNISELSNHLDSKIKFTPRTPEVDPLPYELQVPRSEISRRVNSVNVQRTEKIMEVRSSLPVVAEEQKIMEAIHNNNVVILHGPTGSGKTTQIPQFLYEAGYGNPGSPTPGMIGVTQPRRVATVSMSRRVMEELGDSGSRVAYQIRFDSTVGDRTALKFMTDGVLLREVSNDFVLSKYSAVVLDEAHERSVNTDVLIGMLGRIVDLRAKQAKEDPQKYYPLKLIIMSATMRIADFADNKKLFRSGPPPIVQVEGRQHPVTVHFARKTKLDYVDEAFAKVSRGHKKLPRGAMLVFLTGQNEITALERKLKQVFPATEANFKRMPPVRVSAAHTSLEVEDVELGAKEQIEQDFDSGEDTEFHGLDDDEDREFEIGEPSEGAPLKVHVLPLYSQLPTNQQMRIFEEPPTGSRLIVLATNVAETSLTIPGVRYVFDCGRAKEKKYDSTTGVQRFEVGWISKASASQRAGRAGRTSPGHCYRLYSSAVFERDFDEFDTPEITRTPIEGVVLQLKGMGLREVVNFPFPTPPDVSHLRRAEQLLGYLGALDAERNITQRGRELSLYPLNPRYARILELGVMQNKVELAIALTASLSVPEIFIPENQLNLAPEKDKNDPELIRTEQDNVDERDNERIRKAYRRAHALLSEKDRTCDAIKILSAVCAYSCAPDPRGFCEEYFVREKALKEATQLRAQLHSLMSHRPNVAAIRFNAQLPQPTKPDLALLRQICAAGFVDQVAMRADLHPSPPSNLLEVRKPRRGQDVPYIPIFPPADHHDKDPFVYVHPSSLLATLSPKNSPAFVVYSQLQRSSPLYAPDNTNEVKTKVRMHPLTPLTRPQLANLARGTSLLEYGKPIVGGKIQSLDRKEGKERRECEVEISLRGSPGSMGWPLGTRRVIQRRDAKMGWAVEKEVHVS